MRSPNVIPLDVRRVQAAVSDPAVSAWVAANAGSGKTHVLAQRVINLLLGGVEPEKILCITFTKAAAANMAKRVFDTLAHWTTLDDAALDAAVLDRSGLTLGTSLPGAKRALARRLFARALETPGGLKVHTIHAFCAQLLHQFPFEANVTARFSVLDETAQVQLLEQLTLAVLLEGAAAPDGPLGRALGTAMTAGADQTFRDLVREAIGRRDAISAWLMSTGGVDEAIAALSGALGIAAHDTIDSVEAEFFAGSLIASSEWSAIAAALGEGSKSDCEQARRFGALAALSGSERVETYSRFSAPIRNPAPMDRNPRDQDDALVERLCAPSGARPCCSRPAQCCCLPRPQRGAAHRRSAVLARYHDEKERRGPPTTTT
jgi:ATP-dependent helicase/nuclease subunit A